jgi:hypothetical protein
MACYICDNVMEETDRLIESPCCGIVIHSTCGIDKVATAAYSASFVYCNSCGAELWSPPAYNDTDPVESVLSPEFIADAAPLKERIKSWRKSKKELSKLTTLAVRQFRIDAASHIFAIKNIRAQTMANLCMTNAFKESSKLTRSIRASIKRLSEKHNLYTRVVRKFLLLQPRNLYRSLIYQTELNIIKRKLRCRI